MNRTEYYEILEMHLNKFFYIRFVAMLTLCYGLLQIGFLYSFAMFIILSLIEIELMNICIVQRNRNKRLADLESTIEQNIGNEAGQIKLVSDNSHLPSFMRD